MAKRPDISMSPTEVVGFLSTQHRAVVTALDAGAPVGTVADLRLVDGGLEVTLAPDDDVRMLLAADDRVCVLAEQFPDYYEIKGVVAHGRAAFVDTSSITFRLPLDDVTSFDFAKLPRVWRPEGGAP